MSTSDKVRIECGQCGVGLRVKPERLATEIECPRCHERFIAKEGEEVVVDTFVPLRTEVVESKFCHHCGEKVAKAAAVCPLCGVPQGWIVTNHKHTEKEEADSRKLTTALLAIFLGMIGAHWFYLGKTKNGVIYLLCVFPGCFLIFPPVVVMVLSIIDGVRILGMKSADFNAAFPPN